MLGGFVAGLDAGLTYNTWPLMDGKFVPDGAFTHPFDDATTAQFNHRMMAYVVTAAIATLWFAGRRQSLSAQARTASHLLLATVALQVLLGIWTLLEVVPVWLAALHQLGAVALLTAGILQACALRNA